MRLLSGEAGYQLCSLRLMNQLASLRPSSQLKLLDKRNYSRSKKPPYR